MPRIPLKSWLIPAEAAAAGRGGATGMSRSRDGKHRTDDVV